MARQDYEKYFFTGEKVWGKDHPHPEVEYPVIFLSNGMYNQEEAPVRRTWMPISKPFAMEIKSHTHEFNQFLCFHGTDPKNPEDLGGTVEFTIGEEGKEMVKFSVNKATVFFVKQGLVHSPLEFKDIKDPKKPIMLSEFSLTSFYTRSKERGDDSVKSEYEIHMEKLKAEGKKPTF
jgi:hypothetical protein